MRYIQFYLFLFLFTILSFQSSQAIPKVLYHANGAAAMEREVREGQYLLTFRYPNYSVMTKIRLNQAEWDKAMISEKAYKLLFIKAHFCKPNGELYLSKASQSWLDDIQTDIDREIKGLKPIKRDQKAKAPKDQKLEYLAAFTAQMLFKEIVPSYNASKAFSLPKIKAKIHKFAANDWKRIIPSRYEHCYLLQKSTKQGKSWETFLITGSNYWGSTDFSYAFASSDHIYCLSYDGTYFYGVHLLESTDGGKSWHKVAIQYQVEDEESIPLAGLGMKEKIGMGSKVAVDFSGKKQEVRLFNRRYELISKDAGKSWGKIEKR